MPSLEFWDKMIKSDVMVILDLMYYSGNGFENRARLRGREGLNWLMVPVKLNRKATKILDLEIASEDWCSRGFEAIRETYEDTIFWEWYQKDLKNVFMSAGSNSLWALNTLLIFWFKDLMRIPTTIRLQSETYPDTENMRGVDLLSTFANDHHCDTYLANQQDKRYLDEKRFHRRGLELEWHTLNHPVYTQRYDPFMEGCSIIDAIMNIGPGIADLMT